MAENKAPKSTGENQKKSSNGFTAKIKNFQPSKSQLKLSKIFYVSILVILVAAALFQVGFIKGHEQAREQAKNSLANTFAGSFNRQSNSRRSISGTVKSVDGSVLQISNTKGETESVEVNSETKVIKNGKNISVSEVKEGQKIIVLTTGSTDKPIASRITLRD